ncbi:hypothetical protein BDN72DRAFT_962844 [Pluteus cervinus]|uniref:Uncharacterized protein n=1 Tax=Pluteus cervinus TaxID=181527 RepID=A0ACD3AHL3_9AGAR|nr:hypothetical protein BDN72DRAFT_962844 [Pluteus cervinus]
MPVPTSTVSEADSDLGIPSSSRASSSQPWPTWKSMKSQSGVMVDVMNLLNNSQEVAMEVTAVHECTTVCVRTGDWFVAVSPEGVHLHSEFTGKKDISHWIMFEEIPHGNLLLLENQRLKMNAWRHWDLEERGEYERKIENLQAQISDLKKALANKERTINRKQEKLDCLEGTMEQFSQMAGPLARRSLLDQARKKILLEYYTATRKDIARMVKDHTDQGGDPGDSKISQLIWGQFTRDKAFRESQREGELDTFLKEIHSVVRKTIPSLDYSSVRTACGRDNFIRQAGNEAAHEFDAADIAKYVFVERDDLKKKSSKALRKLFDLVFPDGIEDEEEGGEEGEESD